MGNWAVVERDGEMHIKPEDEINAHGGKECWCCPIWDEEARAWIHEELLTRQPELKL